MPHKGDRMLIIMLPAAQYHSAGPVSGDNLTVVDGVFFPKTGNMKKYFLPLIFMVSTAGAQQWAKQYDFVDDCVCGLAKVSKDGKIGYVTSDGKLVVPLEYDEAITFSEGLAAVRKNTKWGYLDSTGKVVMEPKYEDAASFHEGMAAVRKEGKYGFINREFEVVIPYSFSMAGRFSEGLAAVANSKDQWGYINSSGKLVIGYAFTFADTFVDGMARIMKGSSMKYIDPAGKEIKE